MSGKEFIELLNTGPPLDLSGWRLSDDDTRADRQFSFPSATTLPTNGYLVLFGGGRPRDIPGLVFADAGRIGNGLTNNGDRILLLAGASPDTVIDFTFSTSTNLNRSLTRSASASYVPHDQFPGRALFSPGQKRLLYTHFSIDTLHLTLGQPAADLPFRGHSSTGVDSIEASILRWQVEDKQIVEVSKDGRARGLRPGRVWVQAWFNSRILARGIVLVQLPVPPPNQPPRITSTPDTTVYASGHYRYHVGATDPEGSTLVYTFARAPSWLRLHYGTGVISGRAPPNAAGTAEVAFEAEDGRGGLDAQRFLLHILPRPSIHISEILPNPPAGLAGDANGDGQRQTYGDEFVEFYNSGPHPIDLNGWRVSDGDVGIRSQFCFPPATILPPGEHLVLFGSGSVNGERIFTDDGRLGDGLGNKADEIFLISPEGPDTLARVVYRLQHAANQSLAWPAADQPLLLHGQWPGRDPFSPGRARPVLQRVQLVPQKLHLTVGESAHLKLIGHYSDGQRRNLHRQPSWFSSHPRPLLLDKDGSVTASDTGQSVVSAHLDTFIANPCQVRVQFPLDSRVVFLPAWQNASAPPGRRLLFAVRPKEDETLTYRWTLNGRRQQTTNAQFSCTHSLSLSDTIQVEISSWRETAVRQWILRPNSPPLFQPPDDTLAIAGQSYVTHLRGEDPDGDPLLYFLKQAPPGVTLHPSTGELNWTPPDTGQFVIDVQIMDGYHNSDISHQLRVVEPPAKRHASSAPLQISTSPNPFNATIILEFHLPGEHPAPVSIHLYDIAGQSVRTLVEGILPPGRHAVRWNSDDDRGRSVAAGVYLYRITCDGQQASGKLLFLP